jgi:PPP family 3-phenylpropionic acid transporter
MRSMAAPRGVLPRFILLYGLLYCAFGFASPFLPAFLAERGLQPEVLGLVLGAGTAVRLVSAPLAGRLADVLHAFRIELAAFAACAAIAALLYLPSSAFWTIIAVSLLHAAALAPLVPLSDALALAASRPARGSEHKGFEYGWVRGAGSAAFIAGVLLSGLATNAYGLAAIIWLSALCLLGAAAAAFMVPELRPEPRSGAGEHKVFGSAWLFLLRQPAFVRVTLIAALVLGSHALHDSFAVIRWLEAGIGQTAIAVLWSESVAAEVVVFLFLGPKLLQWIGPSGAMAAAALAGMLRWSVLAQTTATIPLALVEPLHGMTFALLHLASMRIIADTVPRDLAGTAQALYGILGVGGASALLTVASGSLYARYGAGGFWAMLALCLAALPLIWSLHRYLSAPSPLEIADRGDRTQRR